MMDEFIQKPQPPTTSQNTDPSQDDDIFWNARRIETLVDAWERRGLTQSQIANEFTEASGIDCTAQMISGKITRLRAAGREITRRPGVFDANHKKKPVPPPPLPRLPRGPHKISMDWRKQFAELFRTEHKGKHEKIEAMAARISGEDPLGSDIWGKIDRCEIDDPVILTKALHQFCQVAEINMSWGRGHQIKLLLRVCRL